MCIGAPLTAAAPHASETASVCKECVLVAHTSAIKTFMVIALLCAINPSLQ